MRLFGQSKTKNVPLTDYDSAETALWTSDPYLQMDAQQNLIRICRFAFVGREESREASALLLRYFHGYYPKEIARVLNCRRPLVDTYLKIARKKLKVFMADVGWTESRFADLPAPIQKLSSSTSTGEFLLNLRDALLRPANGHCLSHVELRTLYQGSNTLECQTLAHVVYCERCLDEINRLLHLAPLSERNPVDTVEQDKRPRKRSGNRRPPSVAMSYQSPKELVVRIRDVIEHRPEML